MSIGRIARSVIVVVFLFMIASSEGVVGANQFLEMLDSSIAPNQCHRIIWCASVRSINVFSDSGVDPRQEVLAMTGKQRRWRPIGRIVNNKRVLDPHSARGSLIIGTSTGFLVSPCYILTNYHAIFGATESPDLSYTATFYLVKDDGYTFDAILATPVIWGEHDRTNKWGAYDKTNNAPDDWALLKLSICEGNRVGWLDIGFNETGVLRGMEIVSAGYSGDNNADHLWVHQGCFIMEVNMFPPGLMLDNCASRIGASGSPLMDDDHRYLQVVALRVGSATSDPGIMMQWKKDYGNISINIMTIYKKIEPFIKKDMETSNITNPAHAR